MKRCPGAIIGLRIKGDPVKHDARDRSAMGVSAYLVDGRRNHRRNPGSARCVMGENLSRKKKVTQQRALLPMDMR